MDTRLYPTHCFLFIHFHASFILCSLLLSPHLVRPSRSFCVMYMQPDHRIHACGSPFNRTHTKWTRSVPVLPLNKPIEIIVPLISSSFLLFSRSRTPPLSFSLSSHLSLSLSLFSRVCCLPIPSSCHRPSYMPPLSFVRGDGIVLLLILHF